MSLITILFGQQCLTFFISFVLWYLKIFASYIHVWLVWPAKDIPYRFKLVIMIYYINNVGWLVVFKVPSTARSFRDGTPIYCPLQRTWSSINTPFRPRIEPRPVAWQSITYTLPLCYASSIYINNSNFKVHHTNEYHSEHQDKVIKCTMLPVLFESMIISVIR